MGLIKLAGMWDGLGKGLLAAGSKLMSNNVLRNAAIGAGTGAISGAINAKDGQRLSGALKGGLVGGAIGGATTMGTNMYSTMKANPTMTMGQAFKSEVRGIGVAGEKVRNSFSLGKAQGSMPAPTIAPTAPTAVKRNLKSKITPLYGPANIAPTMTETRFNMGS